MIIRNKAEAAETKHCHTLRHKHHKRSTKNSTPVAKPTGSEGGVRQVLCRHMQQCPRWSTGDELLSNAMGLLAGSIQDSRTELLFRNNARHPWSQSGNANSFLPLSMSRVVLLLAVIKCLTATCRSHAFCVIALGLNCRSEN
jgi:hypothetical protein